MMASPKSRWHTMRKNAGLSIAAAARALNVSRQWIYKIESGDGSPSEKMRRRLARAYTQHIRDKIRLVLRNGCDDEFSFPKGAK
jgi:transcriptional regulator with XRE-family HTH domain